MRFTPWLGGIVAVALASAAAAQEDPKALFQARYDAFRGAMAAQDQAAVSAILAPGYTMTDIQGEVRDASAVSTLMQRMPGGIGRNAVTTVLEATVTGDTAAVKQQLAAKTTRPGPDGNDMALEFEVVSNDTWVKSGEVWLLKSSVQKDLTVKRDGEVFFKQSN
ncbi:nuclear transport factor 2 family protein [Novosphingobium sp.]|jgi:ketosteroid isomerase-like protein|uniref:nuclear transport factor 2 family protein n=1 Tax=Novosphingobium sp. TaxID=1874826 RepID=UPI0022C07233|nr:nuclear transport factor 2 family protein [Novosphingobium sp.]MCZ8017994.1 nuclear transport factor 2 family protein [Novosphingobium sp.]MCZ8034313.1 nuclear transport factor 2 family protein [Novosphingobium sp.]MCZ8052281.1 nuclear transport factor 2 family protein [Novosphingobium sp.]MCZ8061291.1 nuclear transport factor 2 family protein [Novosphingobium sp.]MCZ8232777.1 nuclear transport factor 2 family protein [Novosphingobium sp.]